MREQLKTRLAELQREFAAGEQKLREVEGQQARLRDTLLRIDGAMHVLRELLDKLDPDDDAADISRSEVRSLAHEYGATESTAPR